MVTRAYRISGLVQGVGFRWFARREARARDLSGWVRNCADGSVEVVLQGPEPAVDAFATLLARGPAGARVDRVEASSPARPGALPDPFQIM